MDLLESFFKDREGASVVRTEHGFIALVQVDPTNVLCQQFWVHPDFRQSGEGRELLDRACAHAELKGFAKISCTVQANHALRHETLLAVIAGKFQFKGVNKLGDLYFEREI